MHIFIFCHFGERASGESSEMGDEIYQRIDWYTFPLDIQRMIPTILIGAQEPVILRGFGNVTCTRDAFKKVKFYAQYLENGYEVFFENCVLFFIA